MVDENGESLASRCRQIVCADCGFVITQAKSVYKNGSNKGKRGSRQHKPLSTRKEKKMLLIKFMDLNPKIGGPGGI